MSKQIALFGATLAAVVVIGRVVFFAPSRRALSPRTYDANFTIDSTTLGGTEFADGLTWRVDGGLFTVKDGAASGNASGQDPAFATVDLGASAGLITVTYAHVADTSGVVFRYLDNKNYWSVVAASQYGTWNINKTVRGKTSFVANTGSNLYANDTSVQVRQVGSEITLTIDGNPSMRVDDGALADGSGVGLLSAADDQGQTRWKTLSVVTG